MRLAYLVVFLLTIGRSSAELVVGNPQWGFAGSWVEDVFNIVSFEVRNTGPAAFDGDLTLDDGGVLGARSCAPYEQRVFIAPGTVRAVQFYPFYQSSGSWRLSWKANGGGSLLFDQPQKGPPATVILADPEAPSVRSARLRVFNEANFPPNVAATDSLYAVLLDHQPRFDPARREAFLDWVNRGGIVHVAPGLDGQHPHFTDELAVLNIPGTKGPVGSGLIVKHKFSLKEVALESLAQAGYPAPDTWSKDYRDYSDNNSIFRDLSTVTKPNISWGLIYLLTIAYVVLIGPVFYVLRKRDYRWLLAGFAGTVALFAWTFTVVGRRGYGEKQIYHTVALARSLGGPRWDVRQWVHAFATSGDVYRFAFSGAGHLFAAQGDGIDARVVQGKDALFESDIPLFSSRPFSHQGVLTGPDLGAGIDQFETGPGSINLKQLRIKTGPQFPENPIMVVAQFRDRFHKLQKLAEGWSKASQSAETFQETFQQSREDHYNLYYSRKSADEAIRDLERGAGRLARIISSDGRGLRQPIARPPRPDQIRLFVYARTPNEFRMQSEEFLPGIGLVLYVQDLPTPTPPSTL